MNSVMTSSFHVYRQVLYTNTNISLVHPWPVQQSLKKLVEIARKEGAVAICTVLQVKVMTRSVSNLVSKLLLLTSKIIAPWRMTDKWTMQSREDEIAFCKAHGIDLPFDASHSYSRDRNLWHISMKVWNWKILHRLQNL